MTTPELMDLATRAMGNDPAARDKLAAAGHPVKTIGDLHRIQQAAFARMTPGERAMDKLDTERSLSRQT